MSITIRDCLRLPSLKNASVVAGSAGLHNIVSSVSVLEFLDEELFADKDQTISNEMILSALSWIYNNGEAQYQAIHAMKNSGNVCLVLYYLGHCIRELDPRVLSMADELEFPIIVMPQNHTEFRYSEVIGDVYEAIIRDKNKNKAIIHHLSEQISKLPEEKRNLKNLMRIISDRLKCTLLLSDAASTAIYLAKWPLSNDLTTNDIYAYFSPEDHQKETFIQLDIDGSIASAFHVPFSSLEYPNLSLYVLDESSVITMDEAWQVADAIQLFSSMWNLSTSDMLQDALIPSIIENNEERMYQIANKLNIDISVINTLLLIRLEQSWTDPIKKIQTKTSVIRQARTILGLHRRNQIVDTYGDCIAILISYSALSSTDQQIIEDLQQLCASLQIPYSLTICSNSQTTADVRKAYLLYEETIQIARKLYPLRCLFIYSDLELANQCQHLSHMNEHDWNMYERLFAPLEKLNNRKELLDTLAVYLLDANMEMKKTCDLLFLHRNTVQYRLAKIKALINCNLSRISEIYLVLIAVAIYRLKE